MMKTTKPFGHCKAAHFDVFYAGGASNGRDGGDGGRGWSNGFVQKGLYTPWAGCGQGYSDGQGFNDKYRRKARGFGAGIVHSTSRHSR